MRVIEQVSFLLFIKRLDDLHTAREKQANRLGKSIKDPIFGSGQDGLRWSRFREFEAEEMFRVVSQEVFPFIKNLHGGLDIAGITLSVLWESLITSYRNLNTAKFLVIHKIEKRLSISPYDAEWDAIGRGKNPKLCRPISHIEQGVPYVFMVLHVIVLIRTFPVKAFWR